MDGAFVASSGTWKAVKVDGRLLSQRALSIIHLMLIAASLRQLQWRDGAASASRQPHTPYLV